MKENTEDCGHPIRNNPTENGLTNCLICGQKISLFPFQPDYKQKVTN